MTNSIILLALFFVLVGLVLFIISKVTRGIIRLLLIAAIVAISVVAAQMGIAQFAGRIPFNFPFNLGARPSPTASSQPNTIPSTPTPSAPQANPSQPEVQTGETGLAQLPAHVQPFAAPTIRSGNRQANRSTTGAGNNTTSRAANRSQPRTPSQPITAGW